jgi:hypothetical protein
MDMVRQRLQRRGARFEDPIDVFVAQAVEEKPASASSMRMMLAIASA